MILLYGLIYGLYIVLPLIFLFRLWNNRSEDLLKWTVSVVACSVYILCFFVIGGWPMIVTGFYMRYVLLFLLILSVAKSYLNIKRRWQKPSWRSATSTACIALLGSLPLYLLSSIVMSSFYVPEAIDMDFPLRNGHYYILHGGNSPYLNHHLEVKAQKFALDIVKLNRLGHRLKTFQASALSEYEIYGDTVYSPCDGKVLELVDGCPDRNIADGDHEHLAGNYLAIEMSDANMTVLLAHLQKGSFLIRAGEVVSKGQPLARVGNSGNTTEPHLHMHVIKSGGDLLLDGEGVPMKFNNRFLVRNDRVR